MSVPTATIKSESESRPMPADYEIISIDISKEINRIPVTQLFLLDGNAAKGKFPISDTTFFEPGKRIEILMRYEGEEDDATVFKGVVVRHGIEVSADGSMLVVELKDAAIKLTNVRNSAVYRDQTDDQIIKAIVGAAELGEGSFDATQPEHKEIVQYHATDWDFILSRADVQGCVVAVDDGVVSLKKLAVSGDPKHVFIYGRSDIYDLEITLDAGAQFSEVESVVWDIETYQEPTSVAAEPVHLLQGNLNGSTLAESIGFDTYTLSHPVPLAPQERKAWVDARLARNRMSMLRGRIAVPGFADVKPLEVMKVDGVGARFKGTTLVSGVRHRVSGDGWQTDIQFGVSPDWFCRSENIADPPAAGLLPPAASLQIGVVDAFEEDPDKEFRVRVFLPAIRNEGPGGAAVWARLASPDAGEGRGYFFRPETGDEVVVGFFNGDPRQAVILGAMFGSKNTPPAGFSQPSADNIEKGIVSKKGTTIGFIDDEKASIFIETEAHNKILLSDDQELIHISDQHGNAITMGKDGIEITSTKDLKVEASGNVEIKGTKVDVK